jgi:hypothetical protein
MDDMDGREAGGHMGECGEMWRRKGGMIGMVDGETGKGGGKETGSTYLLSYQEDDKRSEKSPGDENLMRDDMNVRSWLSTQIL